MDGGIYVLVTGAKAQQTILDMAASNIANLSTPGFKKDTGRFEVIFDDRIKAFVRDRDTGYIDLSQGALRRTENPLDVAIDGEGFFVVSTPAGTRYTRHGAFTIGKDGVLSTADGFEVLGEGGRIVLSGGRLTIDGEGSILEDGITIDRLKVVSLPEDGEIVREGLLFRSTAEPLKERPSMVIRQGYIEESNVDPVKEMVSIIETYRRYEGQMKLLQAMDEATGRIIKEV